MTDQCHYEVHVKTAKEEMVRRIQTLEQENRELQDSMREKEDLIEDIYQALVRDERGPEAIARLQQGQSYEELTSWLGRRLIENIGRLSPTTEHKLREVVNKQDDPMSPIIENPENGRYPEWKETFANEALTHHLLALYFTWIHPVHMLFSEKDFMASFRNRDGQYCSQSMVTAMCAMGCAFLTEEPFAHTNAKALSAKYAEEARKQVAKEDRNKLTFAISYAILFLVELTSSQARVASSHLRLAVESLRNVDEANTSKDALEITVWGIHTLNTLWAAFTYQKPPAPISPHAQVFEDVTLDQEDVYWQPYRHPGDNATNELPSLAIQTAKELAQLVQIIHETINEYCGSRGRVTARSILNLFRRYLRWKSGLDSTMSDVLGDQWTLPHVLFLHLQYHTALCQLFQPLLDYPSFSNGTHDHIRSLVLQSANEGLRILDRYFHLFSSRYQAPIQLFCIVHVCTSLLRVSRSLPPSSPSSPPDIDIEKITLFCLEALKGIQPGFAFAGPMASMFRQTVSDLNLPLPPSVDALMSKEADDYGPEDLLDACERMTYVQPVDMLLGRIDRSIADMFEEEWKVFIEQHGGMEIDDGSPLKSLVTGGGSPSARSMQITSLVNH